MPTSVPEANRPLLAVSQLATGYGPLRVIESLDMSIGAGEIVARGQPTEVDRRSRLEEDGYLRSLR